MTKKTIAPTSSSPVTPEPTTMPAPVSTPTTPASKQTTSKGHKTKTPSAELAAIVGSAPITRMNALKGIWNYVKVNKLQLPNDKRTIHPDDKLKPLFSEKDFKMHAMMGILSKNLR